MTGTERSIPAEARAEIERRLAAAEREHDVRVIYACESGSRAWGFESTDSDYDARFLYVHRPEWYLSVDLEERRQVIEQPIEGLWDVNGWDLRKALRLFRKSNPPLMEWIQSPIVYLERGTGAARMRAEIERFYAPAASLYHYLHMAQKNFRGYLQGEEVRTKKYLYVLRPLLACRWIERGLGAVPMEFERLVAAAELAPEAGAALERLLDAKRSGDELGRGPAVPELTRFIADEIARLEAAGVTRQPLPRDVERLSTLFRATLDETWNASGGDA